MNNISSIVDQMIAYDLPVLPAGHPHLDGRIHRFGPKKKSWYILREYTLKSGRQVITGSFGTWQGENNNAVPVKIDWKGVSDEEREQAVKKQREIEARENAKRQKMATFAANRAMQQWQSIDPYNGAVSPYLQRKQINAENVRVSTDGTLIVPAYQYGPDGSKLVGLQKIDANGAKRFNKGMNKAGAGLILGQIPPSPRIIMVGEGYATVESVRMASDRKWPAIVAFDVGNVVHIVKWLRRDYPDAHLLFIADDDFLIEQRYRSCLSDNYQLTEIPEINGVEHNLIAGDGIPVSVTACWKKDIHGDMFILANIVRNRRARSHTFRNAGIHGAKDAAVEAGNASVVYPVFSDRGLNKWTDFNDLHINESIDVVKKQITKAIDSALSTDKKEPAKSPESGATPEGGRATRGRKPKERGNLFWDKVNHLLQNFVLIYGTDEVYDSVNHMLLKIQALRLAFGSDEVKFWLNNGERRMVNKDDIVFDPSQTADLEKQVNLFHGWTVEPKPGPYRNIIMLLEHLCNDDQDVVDWILKWIAYPLRNPGAKMRTSIIMHGDEGSGKNLFWEVIVRQLYGEYGCVIGNDEIETPYNEWVSRKLFVVADEVVTKSELRQQKNKLKRIITGETVQVNPKHLNTRVEANLMNIMFLSNELQPLILDQTDRRYLVVWTPQKQDKAFYEDVAEEAKNGGIAAFYHYLLNDVSLDGFNEHTDPPMTQAKEDLITLGLSPSERFFLQWSKGFLPLPFMCCAAQQLYAGFKRWCDLNGERWPPSQTLFGRTIDRIGKKQVNKTVIKYDLHSDVKQRTVYLIGEQPEGKTKSQWAEDSSSLFDKYLKKYRGVYQSDE